MITHPGKEAKGKEGGQEAAADKNPSAPPTLSLPKGGGAVRGIGEKFAANPVTGTGSMTVPIATSPGRSGFGPQLSLSYDSGAGNGPFGFGWSLSLPSITRKTDKGLPQYHDAEESDVFILSGAEDLVPVLKPDGNRFVDTTTAPGYVIHRYRPRIEGLFARIERWTRQNDGDIHWRSISKDNTLTLYGKDSDTRIADPTDSSRVFTWLICETRDDKGNAVLYDYKPEDGAGVDLARAHERNRGDRDDPRRTANRYFKRIRYGNRVPLLDNEGNRPRILTASQILNAGWMFEGVFDYGEHDADAPKPNDAGQWTYRDDPFSSYRAGFEVRTTRLCQRVLMFHHFPDEPEVGEDCLVRSTDFTYSHEQNPADTRNLIYTFVLAVTQSGYKRQNGGYLKRSLPPVEFEYTQPIVQDTVQEVDPQSIENLPIGLDGASYRWTDLHGEGIPGILTEQAGAWFYKRNLSPINLNPANGGTHPQAKFAPIEQVAAKPNLALAGAQAQFMDLAGDGRPDLVVMDGPMAGLYEHDGAESWQPFRPFTDRLNRDSRDPNLKFVDLDGDGHADVLITEDDAFVWHPSLAEAGFGPARRVAHALDEEKGPRIVFADGTQSIYLADLSGDGLTDLVRIRNGEVCYWPNLGYGRFGAKVSMDHAPRFDHPDQFDQKRIRLADIDGTGTTDILYLHRDGVRLYFNQSGNGWSAPQMLKVFPRIDDLVSIVPTDLLGNGTACLVWSSPLPGDARRPMRYVNLMGNEKPHLLIKTKNNLGAETRVQYAPSTKFYLQDKYDGNSWITHLPFPVHVVERVETYDRISRNRFVTRYAYHHGYFDGEEREFRGFGMVEQWDTEHFSSLAPSGGEGWGEGATNINAASHVPPVLTRTWFHTGVYLNRDHISDFFAGLLDENDAGEYYREPGLTDTQASALLLDDTVLPDGLTLEEEREACRALKGSMLRQEVYAQDGTDEAEHPYTVTEQNFTIRRLQPKGENRHTVFFTHPRESINYHYERNPADPRIAHTLTLEVDDFGNVLKSAAVGYGRRQADMALTAEDRAKQAKVFITYTENRMTNAIEAADDYRTPLPCEIRTDELTELTLPAGSHRFTLAEALTAGTGAVPIPYEQNPIPGVLQKRLIEKVRTRYRPDDLGASQNDPLALLPLGTIEPLAIPGESYKLAFTPGLLAGVYGGWVTDAMLDAEGRYVHSEGDADWWIPTGRMFYSPGGDDTAAQELGHARTHFFLPHRYRDPFYTLTVSTESFVSYDTYDLLMVETRDPLGNRVTVGERDPAGNLTAQGNDYRVLQPRRVMDPNRNRTAVAFDALGMVVGTAVMGKPLPSPVEGDSLEDFEADLTEAVILDHLANPLVDPQAILQRATTRLVYDLFAYHRTKAQADPQPAVVYTLVRETHAADPDGAQTKIQHSFAYSDGFGREIQKKIQAEPGPVPTRDANGKIIVGPDGQPEMTTNDVSPRWVGSGWTVFNNKGKPVRQYEPFFTDTHRFEFDVQIGVSPVLFYDPVERVVATLHPNHTWEKVVFDPWRQETWDVNDTVTLDPQTDADGSPFFTRLPDNEYLPTWQQTRLSRPPGDPERQAAEKTTVHAETPTVAHTDSLGRTILTVARNKFERTVNGVITPFDETYQTRVELDIEGNQRAVIDAKDRVVMRYDYDMLGNNVHQLSMEAGERWMLNDVAGKPIRAWDSRGFVRRMTYDALQRPLGLFVTENGIERLAERTVYGEGQGDATNHRTRVLQVFDGAGVVTSDAYDFKGNLRESRRELLPDYKIAVDWQQNPIPNDGIFTSSTTYDALNRPRTVTSPDGSVYRPTFNEANLLDNVEVNLRGSVDTTLFVKDIDYDAKGQRNMIEYGNGVRTTYTYDPLTFRLIHLQTTRASDNATLQELSYTYDPAGNITRIRDEAQQTLFFNGQVVEPHCDYVYDAIYRLIEAAGREHIGQVGKPETTWNDEGRVKLPHPQDDQAMRPYRERYEYDEVGNFLQLVHQANNGNWTRTYSYSEPSLIEPAKRNNRLSRTTVGELNESYAYDLHGNMLGMPHLAAMVWDFEDQLRQVDLGGGGTAYYVYDGAGQRVRKVWEKSANLIEERIYLGGFEIYRRSQGAERLERETLHIMDDNQRIAMVETRTLDTAGNDPAPPQLIRYQFGNHLGSASLELDDQAQIISYEEYTPYGSTSYQAVRSQTETPKRYRYTGMERDDESGFGYHGARYYAVWLGRWLSCDPAGLVDGDDLYRYSRDNPVTFNDPNGMDPPSPRPPKLYPAPTGDRGHPFNRFSDAPNAQFQANWKAATNDALEKLYQGGSFEKNIALYKQKVVTLPKEGGRGVLTAAEHGRILFDRTLHNFKQREKTTPSYDYQGKEPLEGLQIHHDEAITGTRAQTSAPRPERALDFDNLIAAKGGAKGGQPRGTTHHYLHHSENAKDLDEFRAKHNGPPVTPKQKVDVDAPRHRTKPISPELQTRIDKRTAMELADLAPGGSLKRMGKRAKWAMKSFVAVGALLTVLTAPEDASAAEIGLRVIAGPLEPIIDAIKNDIPPRPDVAAPASRVWREPQAPPPELFNR